MRHGVVLRVRRGSGRLRHRGQPRDGDKRHAAPSQGALPPCLHLFVPWHLLHHKVRDPVARNDLHCLAKNFASHFVIGPHGRPHSAPRLLAAYRSLSLCPLEDAVPPLLELTVPCGALVGREMTRSCVGRGSRVAGSVAILGWRMICFSPRVLSQLHPTRLLYPRWLWTKQQTSSPLALPFLCGSGRGTPRPPAQPIH